MNKQEIIEKIEQANSVYWDTGENALPEKEYNSLMERLSQLDSTHSLLTAVSSPQVKSTGKVKHKTPMLSLEKVYTVDELKKWMEKVARTTDEQFILMCKWDGIAARWDGKTLSTRGDGEEGENITDKLPMLNFMSHVKKEYDGELLIHPETFTKKFETGIYKRSGGELYKNSRNAVAGMMNNDEILNEKVIEFVDYNYQSDFCTIDSIEEDIKLMEKDKDEWWDTDGYVVKLKDKKYAESLGHTSHHWKHSMALKHANESAWTVLKDVEFQMAKDHIGMVGILEPVQIDGVTIKRVSLHNLDVIKELQLSIGDKVLIERAGSVIPYIRKVEQRWGMTREITLDHCPSCWEPVIKGEKFYTCDNDKCEDKIVNKMEAAFKDLGGKGISTETFRKLYQGKWAKDIVGILERGVETFMNLGGFQEKSATKAALIINDLIKTPKKPEQIFAAANIPGFGKSLFKKLLIQVPEWDVLFGMKVEDFAKLDGMSNVRAELLDNGFTKEHDLILKLMSILTIEKPKLNNEKENEMITICFTGKGNKSRADYEAMCNGTSYVPMGSVSGALQILVCADPSSDSGKMKKAHKLGVNVISYDEFEDML